MHTSGRTANLVLLATLRRPGPLTSHAQVESPRGTLVAIFARKHPDAGGHSRSRLGRGVAARALCKGAGPPGPGTVDLAEYGGWSHSMAAGSEARGGTPKTPCRRYQATPPRSITCFQPDDTTRSLPLVWVPRRSEVAIARRSGPRRFPSSTVRQAAEGSRVGAHRRRSLRAHGTADREKDPAPNRPQPTRGRSVMKTRTRHLRASWLPSCQAVKVQG